MTPERKIDILTEKLKKMTSLAGLMQKKNLALKSEIVILRDRKNYYKKKCADLGERPESTP